MTTAPPLLRIFVTRRMWGELLYAFAGLFQGVVGFVFTVTTLALGLGLSITFVGLPLLAISGAGVRWFASELRRAGNKLVGDRPIDGPPPLVSKQGTWGWIESHVRDIHAWRARLYLILKLPLGIVSFAVSVAFFTYGLGGVTYAIWRPFLPCQNEGGVCHRGTQLWNHRYVDTFWPIVLLALVGLAVLLAAPWVVRGIVKVDRAVQRALLGPTQAEQRVVELRHSRAVAVDDAATTLRRIERDLHDGAQARLVALAMNVGLAREKLAEGGDAAPLLESAHVAAKEAITELRDLARGIHPPVIDAGLDTSLATLTSRCAVPTTLTTTLDARPDRAIETIAYFCVAELLTNVTKHSGARHAGVDVRTTRTQLLLTVADDGRGGAVIGAGTGLAGLADRVHAVDGRITLDSPDGGPTVAAVELPMRMA